MKNTSLKYVIFLAIAMIATSAFAQTERKSRNRIKNKSERMEHGNKAGKTEKELGELTAALNLSDTQQNEFKVLLDAFHKEEETIKEANKDAKEKAREETKPLKKELEANMTALMTDEQKELFKAYKKKKRENKSQKGNAKTQ